MLFPANLCSHTKITVDDDDDNMDYMPKKNIHFLKNIIIMMLLKHNIHETEKTPEKKLL